MVISDKESRGVSKVEYVSHAFPVSSFLQKTEFDTENTGKTENVRSANPPNVTPRIGTCRGDPPAARAHYPARSIRRRGAKATLNASLARRCIFGGRLEGSPRVTTRGRLGGLRRSSFVGKAEESGGIPPCLPGRSGRRDEIRRRSVRSRVAGVIPLPQNANLARSYLFGARYRGTCRAHMESDWRRRGTRTQGRSQTDVVPRGRLLHAGGHQLDHLDEP